jgi:DNA-binding transcriptional LysR family regulator
VLARLARWELDLALVYDHPALPGTAAELERTHLLDDPFDLIVPERHPLAGRASPVRRIAAARLPASFRSAAAASMLGVLRTTADAYAAAATGL